MVKNTILSKNQINLQVNHINYTILVVFMDILFLSKISKLFNIYLVKKDH
jgi:hypothetical protein